jgi:hypothetical protein
MREVWEREIREEEDMRGVGERKKKLKKMCGGGTGEAEKKKNNLFLKK